MVKRNPEIEMFMQEETHWKPEGTECDNIDIHYEKRWRQLSNLEILYRLFTGSYDKLVW